MPLGTFGRRLRVPNVNPFGKSSKGVIKLSVLRRGESSEERYARIFGEMRSALVSQLQDASRSVEDQEKTLE